MRCTTDELMRKEVINVCTAESLGCIRNFEVDPSCGKIVSFITSSSRGFFSFSSECEVRVPWDKITRIGEDVILVDLSRDKDKDKDDKKDSCDCFPPHDNQRKRHGRLF